MRVVALLATYNERRFIGPCLEHLHRQGVETYLIDNGSTDETVEIAARHRGRGLIGIEDWPPRRRLSLGRAAASQGRAGARDRGRLVHQPRRRRVPPGHGLDFPGIRVQAEALPMKHYLFLSRAQATEKYVGREHDPDELAAGWHGWRQTLTEAEIRLPGEADLRIDGEGGMLDPSNPRTRHFVDPAVAAIGG